MSSELTRLYDVMARLRAECPWDAKQTHRTLVTHLVEETAEVVDAIETGDDADLQAYLQRVSGYCLTGSTQEHALFFLFLQSLTNCQSAMSQGRVPSWHLPRQKIGQNFCRCSVRHECAKLSRERHQFYSCTVRAEL